MAGDNYGIQHSGSGNIENKGVQAFGPHATAIGSVQSPAVASAEKLVAELRELLREHDTDLAEHERADARDQLDTVTDQLGVPREDRDPGIITRALGRLASVVGSVTVLAAKAESLRNIVEQLIR